METFVNENIPESLWDLSKLNEVPKYYDTNQYSIPGFKSFFYEGMNYNGKPTWVYAYYKTPDGKPPVGGWPAVVLVHGGGGTADNTWVQKWVDEGYAAISMDLEGHLPDETLPHDERPIHKNSGPSRVGGFDDWNKPIKEQWYYHAVTDVIRAHTLIKSFAEISSEKTGIAGISWGGIIASTVIGLDSRFKFAIPIYGCGYLYESDGVLNPPLNKYSQFEPAVYLAKASMPVFFINGTNDITFPPDIWQKSADTVKGPVMQRMKIRMGHSHMSAWDVKEQYVFADSIVKEGVPLAKIKCVNKISDDNILVEFLCTVDMSKVEFCFTTDSGKHSERNWNSIAVNFVGGKAETMLPEGTTTYYFNITDKRGLMTSSKYHEINRSEG